MLFIYTDSIPEVIDKDKTGEVCVSCELDKKESVHHNFRGYGNIPFDPLKRENLDVTASAEESDIGGLGIFLTKNLWTK